MGDGGNCGYCCCFWSDWASEEERLENIQRHVNIDDTEYTTVTCIEYSVRTCRAQYVVYCAKNLNVRPKCHRSAQEAPVVKCSACLSRIIWPINYRPGDMADYQCHICASGHKTIVEVEITAFELSKENSYSWLIRNDGKLPEPFNHRSLYRTISTCDGEDFRSRVELFPTSSQENMTLDGKPVRNIPAVIQHLEYWVSGRRMELGTCSPCFSSKRKVYLMAASGRTGCHQRISRACLDGWYGLNAAGRIINTAALFCPFCRRVPTAKTLARYGLGIHAVGNLQMAVEERGT